MNPAILIIIAIVVVVVVIFIALYNGLVQKRLRIDEAFAQIEVQLKRRHDLIPNLVNAVKGYMGFEQKVLTDVTNARAAAVAAGAQGPTQQAAAENALTGLDYNTNIQTFPSVLIAGVLGFTKRDFFDAEPEAANVPNVDLSLS
jgi:hypothetical protein